MTPDELAAEGIRNLATADIPMDEEDSDTCTRSFYSHATAPECLELAAELNDLFDEGASAVEALQLIGLPGIAFNAPRGVRVFARCNVLTKLMNIIPFRTTSIHGRSEWRRSSPATRAFCHRVTCGII